MDVTAIRRNERAVSQVIGVILIVAVTVVIAAVASSFVLTLGDQKQQTTPQATFEFEWDGDASADTSSPLYSGGPGGKLTIEHTGGDTINNARLTIVDDESGSTAVDDPFTTQVTAGTTETIDADADDTIRIIYTGDADQDPVSATLATYEIS